MLQKPKMAPAFDHAPVSRMSGKQSHMLQMCLHVQILQAIPHDCFLTVQWHVELLLIGHLLVSSSSSSSNID